jgi:hypothetical protein
MTIHQEPEGTAGFIWVQIERRHLGFRSGPFPFPYPFPFPFPIALGRRVVWPTPDLDR